MQTIHFGLGLDGQRGWHPKNCIGESFVGPLGLLTILETQLGLTGLHPTASEQVVQMRECLQTCRTGSRFYEKIFENGDLDSAATLLVAS